MLTVQGAAVGSHQAGAAVNQAGLPGHQAGGSGPCEHVCARERVCVCARVCACVCWGMRGWITRLLFTKHS